jgi:hypothetical protein
MEERFVHIQAEIKIVVQVLAAGEGLLGFSR